MTMNCRISQQNDVSIPTALFHQHQLEQIGRQLSLAMQHYLGLKLDCDAVSCSHVLTELPRRTTFPWIRKPRV